MECYSLISCPILLDSTQEPGRRSRYSDRLRAGRPRGWSSRFGRVKNSLLSMLPRPALEATEPLIQRVSGALSLGGKGAGA
jgi:hypothetical protein